MKAISEVSGGFSDKGLEWVQNMTRIDPQIDLQDQSPDCPQIDLQTGPQMTLRYDLQKPQYKAYIQ